MATIKTEPNSAHVRVRIDGWAEIDAQLKNLPVAIRGKELTTGLRKALERIEKRAIQLAPKPGYPGDKKGKKPLIKTIDTVVRDYQLGAVKAAYVGPEYPAGAHGHLVEYGHRIAKPGSGSLMPLPGSKRKSPPRAGRMGSGAGKGIMTGMAKPYPFMGPAAAGMAAGIEAVIIEHLKRAVEKSAS